MKQYQVFLSFRGEDTRKTIVSHLHKALFDRGINVFKDDKRLEIGDSISFEIKEAIHNSKIAVVVISENYASSTWCLNELRMIMKLWEKQKLVVFPVFYDVTPSDVRHQRRTFSLERYKYVRNIWSLFRNKKEKAKRVMEWREALTEIAGISGQVSRACVDEARMVDDIARNISRQLFAAERIDYGDIVGMNAHMERLSPMLNLEYEDDVRMIGIWGMGGVGKTTIAKFLYKMYSDGFAPHRCFIENVRSSPRTRNLLELQGKLLSCIVGGEHEVLWRDGHGGRLIKSRLENLKVFLVVDDIDNLAQLHALAEDTNWFGPGSRIIITTRDKGLFSSSGVKFLYHVDVLDSDSATKVLKHFAFERGQAPSDVYEQLSIQASSLAQGLPSALKDFGTYLRRMTSIEEWEQALGKLEKIPQEGIKEILRTSYKGLDREHKAVFLHVACLFNGNSVQSVKALLQHGDLEIKGLAEKSLIDISDDDYITMHALVEQAGKEIALEESSPQNQTIYWEHEKIIHLLQNSADTHSVHGLALHMCEMPQVLLMAGDVFYRGTIKFLKVFRHVNHTESSKLQFIPSTEELPPNVLLLHWDGCPLRTLHPYCLLKNIVEINLRHSKLERLWDTDLRLSTLRRLDVSCSSNLKEPPNLSRATKLEELFMEGCTRLERLPISIGSLYRLKTLNLSHCDVLANLEIHISEQPVPLRSDLQRRMITLHLLEEGERHILSSLANLSIEGRINIKLMNLIGDAGHISFISKKKIPDEVELLSFYDFTLLNIKRTRYNKDGAPFSCISFSNFPCLAELKLINLNILDLPDDIGQLHSLQKLDLSGNDFMNLPISIKNLSKLKCVKLSNCIQLEDLPELNQLQTLKLSSCSNLKSLQTLAWARNGLLELDLNNSNNIQSLKDQLRHFTNLIHLDISRHDFEAIPKSITELKSLRTLCLNNCKKLKSLEELPQSLQHLYAHGCDSLENVALSPNNHSVKHLDLSHCFSLRQDEQLITWFLQDGYSQQVSQRFICLPGTRVPTRYFDNQSSGTCTKISLPRMRHTHTILGFSSCVMISCQSSFHLQFPALSYDWKCEDDEVIQMNLKPNLYHASEMILSHHLVIIHVPSSINTERIQELRLESHLQLPEEFRFPPSEIRACGVSLISSDQTNRTPFS